MCEAILLSLIFLGLAHLYKGSSEHVLIYKIGMWYIFPIACLEILWMKPVPKNTF